MKPTDITTPSSSFYTAVSTPTSIKFTVLFLLSLIITFLFSFSPYFPYTTATTFSFSTHPSPPPRPPIAQRLGLVDENGAMRENFDVSPIDPVAIQNGIEVLNKSENERFNDKRNDKVVRYEKFQVCEESKREFIPCLDNVEEIKRLNLSRSVERFERHCPVKALDCLVPAPKRYQKPIPWPQSRDEVWFSNVPHTRLVEDKGGQNWIAIKDDKFIFPGGGTQFIHGADQYLNQISMMVHDMSFGFNIRTALDIGCGVASFGAFLLERSTITLSIAPKDVHENQIQFALERGVPAMIAVFSTRRLLYPSQAFDMIHCSRCRIDWWSNDGILLLEVNRMLRAGGYFVWAAQPVYKHEDKVQEQWKEMLDLTSRICWKLVKKEGYIAIWQKPLNNCCYINRNLGIQPPLCDSSDDPDIVWYAKLKNCITRLPENGYGANVTTWPIRLHLPPDRVQSTKMDAYLSRKDIVKAETKYWYEIIDGYIKVFGWKEMNFRNVMDMRAGFGGFAAALDDHNLDCWVMNVVPVNGFNTLPVIYDRGLIGVVHDWCESFDTYPRTYDLLNAAGLFSAEQKRKKCNISTIMLEMDRILRPDGLVYIRDTLVVINELQAIANAMGWLPSVHDSFEGPHTNWKILICEKRMR